MVTVPAVTPSAEDLTMAANTQYWMVQDEPRRRFALGNVNWGTVGYYAVVAAACANAGAGVVALVYQIL